MLPRILKVINLVGLEVFETHVTQMTYTSSHYNVKINIVNLISRSAHLRAQLPGVSFGHPPVASILYLHEYDHGDYNHNYDHGDTNDD